jgi:polysaccharide export outer membrane protein
MNIQRLFGLSIAVACCVLGVVQAQQPVTPKPEPAGIETQAQPPYLLGPGDVLEVTIDQMTHPTMRIQVSGTGYINLALIGRIKAKCLTELQLQQDITTALDRYIKEPSVNVLVLERNSRTPVSISGAVRQNTKVPTLRKLRLNELIAAAGGFTERAAGTIQILHTEPVMCPEPGQEAEDLKSNGTSIPLQVVKISDLLKGTSNPEIRPGDLVLVTEAEPVYITGSVVSPGSIMLRDKLTLSRALATVGGTRKEAKVSEITIYRQIPDSTDQKILKVDLAAIKKNQTPDVLLEPYDVIDVSENGFTGAGLVELLTGIFLGGVRHSVPVPIP